MILTFRDMEARMLTRIEAAGFPEVLRKGESPEVSLGALISLATTYSPAFNSTIGAVVLTSVFGMGTGVAPPLWSPGIVFGLWCDSRARPRNATQHPRSWIWFGEALPEPSRKRRGEDIWDLDL